MIKINTESTGYSIVADILSTIIGFGASAIVNAFCNATIGSSVGSTPKNCLMKVGRFGLETMTIYSVASEMRDQIDDLTEMYNNFAGAVEVYQREKNSINS